MNAESGEYHRSDQVFPGRPAFLGMGGTNAAHRRQLKSIIERESRAGKPAGTAMALSRPDPVEAHPSPARIHAGNTAAKANNWEEF